MGLRGYAKKQLRQLGYEIRRRNPDDLGFDPYEDMRKLTHSSRPVLFDIGANIGQTIDSFRNHFQNPVIHAFEPSTSTYAELEKRTAGIPNLCLNKFALGARRERKVLIENSISTLTSLLPPGAECWGEIVGRTDVDVDSVDGYCEKAEIPHIDVLKSDTQGFDFEVLSGSNEMFRQHKIHLVFVELNFCDLYEGMAHFEKIYSYLQSLGLVPVAFYNQNIRDSTLGWTDGLFIHKQFQSS